MIYDARRVAKKGPTCASVGERFSTWVWGDGFDQTENTQGTQTSVVESESFAAVMTEILRKNCGIEGLDLVPRYGIIGMKFCTKGDVLLGWTIVGPTDVLYRLNVRLSRMKGEGMNKITESLMQLNSGQRRAGMILN